MIHKLNILEIRKDAIGILKEDSNTISFYAIYYIIPISMAIGLIFGLSISINSNLFSDLIAGISLFSGLLFSIIFIVSNNYKERKISHNSQDEENIRYLERYHSFSSNLISLISHTIIKALYIIIFTVIISLGTEYIGACISEYIIGYINIGIKVLHTLLFISLYQFLLYVIIILKQIYIMQYEEINRKS